MNKEVEKIRKEVERRTKGEQGFSSEDAEYGYHSCAEELLSIIDSLQEESISEDLKKYAEEWDESLYRSDAVIAGAEWKEEKLLENGVKTHFNVGLPANIWKKLKEKGVEDGDELLIVKV